MNETPAALKVAARRCIARDGLAATTSRQITAEAGANLAAITYHFGSKDELVAEALLDGFRTWLQPTIDVLGRDGEPVERTLAAIQSLLTALDEHPDEAAAYLQALAHAPASDSLRTGVTGLWADLRRLVAADIEAVQSAGRLDTWIDPATMAGVLVAVANGFLVQSVVDPSGPSAKDLAAQFVSLMLAAHRDG